MMLALPAPSTQVTSRVGTGVIAGLSRTGVFDMTAGPECKHWACANAIIDLSINYVDVKPEKKAWVQQNVAVLPGRSAGPPTLESYRTPPAAVSAHPPAGWLAGADLAAVV